MSDGAAAARALGALLASARRIVAFTGAGISTESGIPDFRSPGGLWSRVDPSEFTYQNYVANPEHRRRVWQMRAAYAETAYEPNPGHRALVELEALGILDCVITQNIDGLHADAGSSTVIELHGTNRFVRCLACGAQMPTAAAIARVRAGEEDPACKECGGVLKTATVSFGEAMPERETAEAFARAEACDLCLVVGSSLAVYPAAGVPAAAVRAGARLAIVNAEPTPLDDAATLLAPGRAGDVLPAAVAHARHILRGS